MIKFVHAADIHLDSPLRGLEAYPGAPTERLRIATRQAFDRVVELCLEERVDFLVLAGDLFDTDVKDFHAALAAAAQLRRLDQADIPVYLILGNHDSREETTRHVPWPANVTVFNHDSPHTVRHPRLPVALHGMSYPKRAVTDNLVPRYPAPVADCLNIGLLHTNAGGNSQHAAYAPCSVEELVGKGYDYWALGHVHDHAVLHAGPHVVYSGNTQGRHVGETGPKGCLLVTAEQNGDAAEIRDIEFRETAPVRWFREKIFLEPADDEEALCAATRNRLREIVAAADGRLAAVRLEYTGRCAVHAQLAKDISRQQLMTGIRSLAADFGDVWVEKIKFDTRSPHDLEALRERQDLLGRLLRDGAALAADPQLLPELPEARDLAAKLAADLAQDSAEAGPFDLEDRDRRIAWLRDAEALLLSHLLADQGDR